MSKLPLEELKEKYIPIVSFPEKYNISVAKIMSLISNHKIKYAEFRAPGDTRRTMHVNPDDVFEALKYEENHV